MVIIGNIFITLILLMLKLFMVGMGGFEPPHDGIKNRCLTAWLHPNGICR